VNKSRSLGFFVPVWPMHPTGTPAPPYPSPKRYSPWARVTIEPPTHLKPTGCANTGFEVSSPSLMPMRSPWCRLQRSRVTGPRLANVSTSPTMPTGGAVIGLGLHTLASVGCSRGLGLLLASLALPWLSWVRGAWG
jgi:hypothetical protein